MKRIAILGSTGSIGTQALDVINQNRDKFSVSAVSCSSSIDLLCRQIEKFAPEIAVVEKEEDRKAVQDKYPDVEVLFGMDGLVKAATCESDMVLNSLVGMRGLVPTYHAIKAGRDIALANKETLVAGGELIMAAAAKSGVKLLPVDSEHSAIFQCLQGNDAGQLRRVILTASGGPFRGYSLRDLEEVTLAQALKHPTWSMGSKITIDSATMMNKGLEIIEAKWLFDLSLSQIEVAIHPQSVVHSAVEYKDGSVIAQLGQPDMRIPISYAFGYPSRIACESASPNIFSMSGSLTFEEPRPDVFKTIKLAYEASLKGGSYPIVLNGANEVLVQQFLEERIKFIDIQNRLEEILNRHIPAYNLELDEILQIDNEARRQAQELLK